MKLVLPLASQCGIRNSRGNGNPRASCRLASLVEAIVERLTILHNASETGLQVSVYSLNFAIAPECLLCYADVFENLGCSFGN